MVKDLLRTSFLFLLLLAWAAIAALAVYPSLPDGPLNLEPEDKDGLPTVRLILPEGWNFFTRNPREQDILLFQKKRSTWKSAIRGPHGRPSNLFGLDRSSRSQGLEYAMLLRQISSWEECGGAIPRCLDTVAVADTLINPSPQATLCGAVGFARREPIPWAWSRSSDTIHMPSKVARASVRCSKD